MQFVYNNIFLYIVKKYNNWIFHKILYYLLNLRKYLQSPIAKNHQTFLKFKFQTVLVTI
jgi:capsule polysaccharide modification protein KpsS